MEYEDVLVQGDERAAGASYRLFDENGQVLALRSDMTIPIARLVATRYADAEPPLRLCYLSHAYRAVRPQRGQQREFLQAGRRADRRRRARAARSRCWRCSAPLSTRPACRVPAIGLGDAGLFREGCSRRWASSPRRARECWRRSSGTTSSRSRARSRIARLIGRAQDVARDASAAARRVRGDRAAVEIGGEDVSEATSRLRETAAGIERRGIADRVIFDLGLVRDLGYYTRRDLRGLRPGARARDRRRWPLRRAARRASAVRCRRAASRSTSSECTWRRPRRSGDRRDASRGRARRERAASPRRAAGSAVRRHARPARLDRHRHRRRCARTRARCCSRARSVTLVTMRPSDVPTYVEAGAVDLGITGKDVLMEQQERVVYELVDLGYGHCRMVVATTAGNHFADELERRLGAIRIATKYPRIASRYFEESGRQAEVIEVKGSVELAPLVGPRGRHRRPDRDRPHAARERPRDPRGDRRLHRAAGREPGRAQAAAGGDRRARGADRCALERLGARFGRAAPSARPWLASASARLASAPPELRRRGARDPGGGLSSVATRRWSSSPGASTAPPRRRGAARAAGRLEQALAGARPSRSRRPRDGGRERAGGRARPSLAEDVIRRAAPGPARRSCRRSRSGVRASTCPAVARAYPSTRGHVLRAGEGGRRASRSRS